MRASRAPGRPRWEDPSLVQLWGPRFSAYVVAARDLAVFSLGRCPTTRRPRRSAEDLAARLHAFLDGRRMTYGEAGRALGVHAEPAAVRRADRHGPDPLGRRAAADDLDRAARPRSTRATRASSSRAGTCTSSAPPRPPASPSGPGSARGEAARRSRRSARSLTPVRTPIGDAWILAATSRRSAPPGARGAARGCSRAATPTSSCRAPIASSWSPTPIVAARSGPRASGRAPSWSMARSSGRGGVRRDGDDPALAPALARGTRRGRGGGGSVAAARFEDGSWSAGTQLGSFPRRHLGYDAEDDRQSESI